LWCSKVTVIELENNAYGVWIITPDHSWAGRGIEIVDSTGLRKASPTLSNAS
jgi:hypothetical protein